MHYYLKNLWKTDLRKIQLKRWSLLIFLTLTVCACSNAQHLLEVQSVQTEITKPNERPLIALPDPVELRRFNWDIIEQDGIRYLAITPTASQSLAYNQAEQSRYIRECTAQLRYYRKE